MLTLLVMLTTSHATPSGWEEVVHRLVSPLHARWTPDEALPHLIAACDAGVGSACRLELGEALVPVLANACQEGDAVACTGVALQQWDADPRGAFELAARSCRDGDELGCTVAAWARFEGHGTWRSRHMARGVLEERCEQEQSAACVLLADLSGDRRPVFVGRLLEHARELGASGADQRLAMMATGPERRELLEAACASGGSQACWELAVQDRTPEWAARSCLLGRDEACVVEPALALERGEIDLAGAEAMTARLCRGGSAEGCVYERFYRNGGRPAPFPVGTFGPTHLNKMTDELVPFMLDCYRERLERGQVDPLTVPLDFAVSADGHLLAATGGDDPDDERCFAEALHGLPVETPSGGPTRGRIGFVLTHEAGVDVMPAEKEESHGGLAEMEWRLVSQLGLDANICYLEHGGSVYDHQFAILRGHVSSTGWYTHDTVVESSGSDETDACLAKLVTDLHTPEFEAWPHDIFVRFDFNRTTRAPRWAGWSPLRRMGVPPLDLSRHNSAIDQGLGADEPAITVYQ